MAYEYNLSPIDIDGAIKAVQDNAFRAEQLRLKYEESISKSVDDQYKMYGGKVRKQDQAEFDGLFSQYAEAQKRYQSLNRFGGNRAELTKAAGDAQMYKNNMMAYIKESTSWGATQTGMAKIYKDGSKLLNRKKYDDAWMNMSSMTTNELKEVYTKEGKNTFPTDFDFKEEDYGPEEVMKFSRAIKQSLPISAPNTIKEMPVIDPATGKPINTLNRNGMIGTIPQDSVNYYRNKISNAAGFADGGYIAESGIHIDPSKRGTFTAAATKHGESVQGFASQVLANKENYSPAMVKKANFARNAAKWKKADGGPMITHVKPSPHTYFELMTRQGRQVPETPNFMAADGMSMPVTDADRQAYNNYVLGMKKLPGYDNVNWQHDQTFQKQAAQQLGFDYSKAAAIQADMQARNQSMPGTIKGVQAGDTWGGDPTWVGNRERHICFRCTRCFLLSLSTYISISRTLFYFNFRSWKHFLQFIFCIF